MQPSSSPASSWRSRLASAALAGLLLAVPISTSARQSAEPAPNALPSPKWERTRDYDVLNYRLAANFDWQKRSVAGEMTITLKPFSNGLREVVLDAGAMTISSVTLVGGSALKYTYGDGEKLRVQLDRSYNANESLGVDVVYSAVPKSGLIFITPSQSDPTRPSQIWSSGEAEQSHYWFPCYDYPNDRATAETFFTVDDKYLAISNGELVDVTKDAGKKTATYHWRMDKEFPSYLLSVVVGEFAEIRNDVDGVPVSSYVPKARLADAQVSLAGLPKMVRFFSDKLGVKYPYRKYAQVAVRDFPGALENITATTMSDNLIHDARSHIDLTSDDTTSHELAHQWFGDLVTCRTWADLWLNEGFATYMAHCYEESDLGHDTMLYNIRDDHRGYFNAWGQGDRRPIVTNRYDDPDSLFDSYAYARASSVLHMLRVYLGDDAWWKSLHRYLEKNALQSVETAQLKEAIEETTGRSMDWFFDEWVYKIGHPELEVSYTYDAAAKNVALSVKQTQMPPKDTPWPFVGTFMLPVDVAVTTASGEHVTRVWIDKAAQTITIPTDGQPLIVNFDRGNTLIKLLKFEKPKAELLYQAQHDTDAMGRTWAIGELKKLKDDDVARILGGIATSDAFWGVRADAANALGQFGTETAKQALLPVLKDSKSAVRREAVKALGSYRDKALAGTFIKLLETDESYYVAADSAKALGSTGAPEAFDALTRALDVKSEREVIRTSALNGLAMVDDSRVFAAAVKYANAPYGESVRIAAVSTLLGRTKDGGAAKEELFKLLVSALQTGSPRLKFTAVAGLAQLGDTRAIPSLEAAAATGLPGSAGYDTYFKQFTQHTIDSLKSTLSTTPPPATPSGR